MDVDGVAAAADSLLALGMLRSVAPCCFEHALLRSAVESEIAPARRGVLHLKAARALATAGLSPEAVCAHLLLTAPCGEPWVTAMLRQAAARASARGAPASAARYLERALAVRPQAPERRDLLLALGKAESRLHRPQAPARLREALSLAENPEDAAATAFVLGQTLFNAGAFDESYEAVRETVERTDGHEGPRHVELQALLLAIAGPAGRMPETAERAVALESATPHSSPVAGVLQATLALRDMVAGSPRGRVHERAERAADRGGRDSVALGAPRVGKGALGMAFIWTDDLDRAEQLFDGMHGASRRGRIGTFESFAALRGYTLLRRGDLANAAAEIEPVLASAADDETRARQR